MEMLQGLLQGFLMATSWEIFPYIAIGAICGTIIGVIPGLSGHFSMSLLIPFIFGMDAYQGVAFILGSHAAVAQGGGVTAILFSVPGTNMNAATLLDGPALTAKGEGGRAVGAAMMACLMGAIFGVFVLTMLIPVLRTVVLFFGSAEFFMLSILALTFIAVLTGKGLSINRGLIAATIGLLLSYVGMNIITGQARFTFGRLELYEGFPMICAILGVFAVSEMLYLWLEGGNLASKDTDLSTVAIQKQVFQGVLDTIRRWKLVIRCSVIGVVIGVIPGVGSNIAAFLSYGHAKQSSKTPELFGTGFIDGVIAPESANDAVEGGALASTLAFGIPGSSSMAILLGALLIMGVQPGPQFLVEYLDMAYMIIWTVVIGNLVGTILGIFLVNPLSKITFFSGKLVAPVLIAVVLTSAYVVRGLAFDLFVIFIFGILGYAFKKLDYSRSAFLVAFVLGYLIERNLYLSLQVYGNLFFLQPIAFVLLMICIFAISYNVFKMFRDRRLES